VPKTVERKNRFFPRKKKRECDGKRNHFRKGGKIRRKRSDWKYYRESSWLSKGPEGGTMISIRPGESMGQVEAGMREEPSKKNKKKTKKKKKRKKKKTPGGGGGGGGGGA